MDAIVTAQNMIYKLSFGITFVTNNPHIAIWDSLFLLWDDTGVSSQGGGGGTRCVRQYGGVCRSSRSLFWEKSLNIGYGFELKIPKQTPHFCNFRPFRR